MNNSQHLTDQIIDAINQGITEHQETIERDQEASTQRRSAKATAPTLSQVVAMLSKVLSDLAELKAATT